MKLGIFFKLRANYESKYYILCTLNSSFFQTKRNKFHLILLGKIRNVTPALLKNAHFLPVSKLEISIPGSRVFFEKLLHLNPKILKSQKSRDFKSWDLKL